MAEKAIKIIKILFLVLGVIIGTVLMLTKVEVQYRFGTVREYSIEHFTHGAIIIMFSVLVYGFCWEIEELLKKKSNKNKTENQW